ncbi:MAG: aminoacyl-tRNA hydrolase, partial [Clostridia bacterium]|nr:aminoacyl-tRNA hydrolase [Clostridia bacterium]
QSFPRIKMGVGAKPNPDYDLADWVLSTFKKDEQEKLFETFGVALQGLEKILSGDVDSAMQICNSKKA